MSFIADLPIVKSKKRFGLVSNFIKMMLLGEKIVVKRKYYIEKVLFVRMRKIQLRKKGIPVACKKRNVFPSKPCMKIHEISGCRYFLLDSLDNYDNVYYT